MIPPDIELAEKHAISRTVRKPIDLDMQTQLDQEKYEDELRIWNNYTPELKQITPKPSKQEYKFRECPCCSYQIDRTDLSLCCDNREFRFLGSGYSLFFNYIKWCITILVVYTLVSGIFDLWSNY